LGDLVLNGRVVIKWILKMSGVRVWNAIIWPRIVSNGGLLWTRYLTFGLHEKGRISRLAERVLASQEGMCSIVLAIS
jgi:hypothetical protein